MSKKQTIMRQAPLLSAVFAALSLTTADPADAKVTIVCKNEVVASGPNAASEADAKSAAMSKWIQVVGSKYGRSFAQISKARNKRFQCKDNPWFCRFRARPCGQVKPPSASSS